MTWQVSDELDVGHISRLFEVVLKLCDLLRMISPGYEASQIAIRFEYPGPERYNSYK